jgi:hypothetical protein
MSFMQAHNALSYGLSSMVPNPPKWVGTLVTAAALVAAATDFAAGRAAERPLPRDDTREKLSELYRQKAKEAEEVRQTGRFPSPAPAAAIAAPGVGVTINVAPQLTVSPPTSRYMMEEGQSNINVDCFSCATGHLAATEKGLERALEVARTEGGTCGPRCQKLAQMAVEEPISLLAADWTNDRIRALPPAQKDVITRYRGEVRGVVSDLVGSEQVQALHEAKGLLDESVRFLNAGDGLDHPEVAGRLSQAEADLAAAERLDIDAFDVDTANKLRTIRQAVGSQVNSPEDLKAVRLDLKDLTARINDRTFAGIDTGALADAHRKVADIRERFTRDRKGAA